MELQSVCDGMIDDTEGMLACAVLDLDTGLGLARAKREDVDEATTAKCERIAVAIFRGQLMRRFTESLTDARAVESFVQEAQVTTEGTYQFMSTVPGWQNALFLLLTERSMSIGLGRMVVHQAFERIARSRPDIAAGLAGRDDTPPAREPPAATRGDADRANAGTRPPSAVARPPAIRTDPRDGPREGSRDRTDSGRVGPRGAFFRSRKHQGG